MDNINTVNFSNHTGYGHFEGCAIGESELKALFKGLNDINCKYDVVVLGYVPSADLIDIIADQVGSLKAANDSTMYICDTVMGDQGHLYVDDSCVKAYRRLLATGVADVITPNQFELELLYGSPINDEESLRGAITYAHDTYGVRHVVVSSLDASVLNLKSLGLIHCAVSSRSPFHPDTIHLKPNGLLVPNISNGAVPSLDVFTIPEIKSYFTGVGDLFTALLADKLYSNGGNISKAVNQVLTIMGKVLKLTHRLGMEEYKEHMDENMNHSIEGRMNDSNSMRFFELRIVQSREFYNYEGEGDFTSITF